MSQWDSICGSPLRCVEPQYQRRNLASRRRGQAACGPGPRPSTGLRGRRCGSGASLCGESAGLAGAPPAPCPPWRSGRRRADAHPADPGTGPPGKPRGSPFSLLPGRPARREPGARSGGRVQAGSVPGRPQRHLRRAELRGRRRAGGPERGRSQRAQAGGPAGRVARGSPAQGSAGGWGARQAPRSR